MLNTRQLSMDIKYVSERCRELRKKANKSQYENSLKDAEAKLSEMDIDEKKLRSAFNKAKRLLKSGTLKNQKAIVEQYVKQVIIYKDKITVEYNISGTYTVKEEIQRKNRIAKI